MKKWFVAVASLIGLFGPVPLGFSYDISAKLARGDKAFSLATTGVARTNRFDADAPSPAPELVRAAALRDWRQQIDTQWGPGLPTAAKLKIFDRFWKTIDRRFACFQDLDIHWTALRRRYRAEIISGVSAGRFAAIMNHLSRALHESHTVAYDAHINVETPLEPGVPLLAVGGWGENGHFGAALTPLPDKSLLVYAVVPNHPLGLEVGDIVLGYDGVAWKDLYPQLIDAELPLAAEEPLGTPYWGSSPSSYEHAWLISAGLNWHLFDTIDVVKHDSGETVHLPTAPLNGQHMQIWGSEQLAVPGVPFPQFQLDENGQFVSYGVVEGTQIGYIYVWAWVGHADEQFRAAVAALVNSTSGLIIDFRLNFGGDMFLSNGGLSLLFPRPVDTIAFAKRTGTRNHFAMTPDPNGTAPTYVIPSNGIGYDKPIAVLVGPGAVSAGDQVALRMRFHPRARFFGESTSTAFNAPTGLDLGDTNWHARYAAADAYLLTNPTDFLTHDELVVDEPVWHTQAAVVQGRDAVVDAAVEWINLSASSMSSNRPDSEVHTEGALEFVSHRRSGLTSRGVPATQRGTAQGSRTAATYRNARR